jgi:7,8-dihydropterin-6-yl-methyl-4-(beta-D-ribofuranosyl)aminobenzene 5'-phosphate synthase
MKITIVYDNETWQPGLEAAWGFSCLIEANGQRLLFDTGGRGAILLQNLQALNLDPRTIENIFISHDHWDHLGGLEDILRLNGNATVYLPGSCSKPFEAGQVFRVREPCSLFNNFYSTGELPGGEQSLMVKTGSGLVVVCGCSHPGVGSILAAASAFGAVKALVGGLHGFKEYEVLADLALICPCHCTQHKAEIMARYPETTVSGGVGKVLEVS